MLDKDPITRYSTDEVKLHPWIADSFKDSGQKDERKFKEVIEDNSEYYDDNLQSNKKLIKGTGTTAQFTTTKNIRRASVARNSEKNRRLSSRPDQIAKRLQNIPNLSSINVVKEEDVFDPGNYTQNAIRNFPSNQNLGDRLESPNAKIPNATVNDFTTIQIFVPSNFVPKNKAPSHKEVSSSYKSKPRSKNSAKRHKQNVSQSSKRDNFLLLERKFCFNESRLKQILSKFKLPIDHNSLRVMKEHVKD
jgi:hypothetical protein